MSSISVSDRVNTVVDGLLAEIDQRIKQKVNDLVHILLDDFMHQAETIFVRSNDNEHGNNCPFTSINSANDRDDNDEETTNVHAKNVGAQRKRSSTSFPVSMFTVSESNAPVVCENETNVTSAFFLYFPVFRIEKATTRRPYGDKHRNTGCYNKYCTKVSVR